MNPGFLDTHTAISSPLRDLNPLLKFLFTVILLVLINLSQEVWIPAYYGVFLLLLIFLSRVPLRWFLRKLLIILPFLIILSFLVLIPGLFGQDSFSLNRLGHIWIKTIVSFVLISLLSAVTPFNDLLITMERLRLPRTVVLVSRFAYTYLYVIFDEWNRTFRGLKSRASRLRRKRIALFGHICAFILIKTYLRSRQIFNSMISRNFIGFSQRLQPLVFTRRDLIALAAFLTGVAPGVLG